MKLKLDVLKEENVIGNRVQPSSEDLLSDTSLEKWIRSHVGTAYHWMSTCKAGKNNDTAVDEKFMLRGIENLRIGSGAVLPEIPYGNPHLTISAFSVALAYSTLNIKGTANIDMLGKLSILPNCLK
ncbi:MAG: hypothetical protein JSR17_01665 [Proteobacteria bacterium]|nr:hypothetical protein [Pseudomonadota bacterium]